MKKIIYIFSIITLIFTLFGCGAPAFVIKSLDDKFADPNQPFGTVGQNNRLSTKSSQGGIHADEKGVYIDPFIFRDRKTNEITSIGFYINHFNFDISSGFNPIEEIIFITNDGGRVSLKPENRDFDYDIGSWNTISQSYSSTYRESGLALISLEDFEILKNATWIEAKIVGGKRTQTYDKDEISQNFLTNIKNFYKAAIK